VKKRVADLLKNFIPAAFSYSKGKCYADVAEEFINAGVAYTTKATIIDCRLTQFH
jgi:hypothetical protein